MKTSFRAAIAAGLLVGLPVLVLVLIVGMGVADVVALKHAPPFGLKLLVITVILTFVLILAVIDVDRPYLDRVPELPVSLEEQPRLWALVRELADAVGTHPPDEICLVPGARAVVTEETRMLGLRTLRRRMFLGAPLLAALREDQLRAVLAHELAHYSNNDTRLAGLTYRGRRSIERSLAWLDTDKWYQQVVRQVFVVYANMYFRVSNKISRRQELAADEAAARLIGPRTTAEALREIRATSTAWDLFMDGYADVGWRTRYLPEHLSDGFFALLASEERQRQLDEIRRNPGDENPSPYDSHPPMSARIAILEALPTEPAGAGTDRPAHELLLNTRETLDAAMETGLTGKALAKGRLDWPTLIDLGCRSLAVDRSWDLLTRASRVMSSGGTLATVLDALDAGYLSTLAESDEDYDEGDGFDESPVRKRLSLVVEVALSDAGAGRWELSWSGPAKFVADEPHRAALEPAVEEAVSDEADTTALRALLAKAGVSPAYRPSKKAPITEQRAFTT